MTIIKGHYRIAGASPDGDSVRFYPDDPDVWEHAGIAVKANSTGGVQLRLDAIDALETHYTPPHAPTQWRQPTELGDGASAALLDLLGFTDVARDDRGYVTSATPDQTRGHILTRFADTYGRAVATAEVSRRRTDESGKTIFVSAALNVLQKGPVLRMVQKGALLEHPLRRHRASAIASRTSNIETSWSGS